MSLWVVKGGGHALFDAGYDTVISFFWKATADGDFPVQEAGIRSEVV